MPERTRSVVCYERLPDGCILRVVCSTPATHKGKRKWIHVCEIVGKQQTLPQPQPEVVQ